MANRPKYFEKGYVDKSFDLVSHRLYFVVDLPCEEAFEYYMYITRQTAFSALVTLSKIPKKEIQWVRKFVKKTLNFKYKVSVDEKLDYIKELKRYYGSNRLQV